MTDKERIFMAVIASLYSTQIRNIHNWGSEHFKDGVHFAPWDEPKPGDLVLAQTGGMSKWKIGVYVEKIMAPLEGAAIREIGTDFFCNYSNESFIPIKGMDLASLLEGEEYKFYMKVIKAFRKGDEYIYRFGGVDFKDKVAVVWVREVFGGMVDGGTEPFSVKIKWDKKTTIKTILKQLRSGGYGKREFKKRQPEAKK